MQAERIAEATPTEYTRPIICGKYSNIQGVIVEVLAVCEGYVVCDLERVFTREFFDKHFMLTA